YSDCVKETMGKLFPVPATEGLGAMGALASLASVRGSISTAVANNIRSFLIGSLQFGLKIMNNPLSLGPPYWTFRPGTAQLVKSAAEGAGELAESAGRYA